jgi:putative transposase
MDTNTLTKTFLDIFNRDEVLLQARATGALTRLRNIHPLDFAASITGCALGDETRSIASARRHFGGLTGYMPEESSFHDRFNGGSAALMKNLFLNAMENASVVEREAIAKALGDSGILDLWAVDSTQVTLPRSAADAFPSTNEDHGGVKVTTILSLLFQTIKRVEVDDAVKSDRKALKLKRWLHGILLLFDLGYFDHVLFADIDRRGGFFVSRLKECSFPVIERIRSGLGQCHVGKALDGSLPYRGVVDVDARFKVRGGKSRVFRVVGVPIENKTRDGFVERDVLWFVTNLPSEQFSAEAIATLYRFRWEIEQLFRVLKMVGRLDQLRTAKAEVIHTFVYATLLGVVLTHDICAQMRRARPEIEPSVYRVYALVLQYMPMIIETIGTRRFRRIMMDFERALWREGVNPNPGRHYKSSIYAKQLYNAA